MTEPSSSKMNLLFLLRFVSFLLSPWLSLLLAHFYVLLCQLSISVLLLTPRCVCRQAELWHAGLHSQSPSIPQPPVLFSLLCKNHSPQLYQTLGCITQTRSNSCHSFLKMSKAGIVPVRGHQQTDKENRPALSTRVNIDSGCCWRAPFLLPAVLWKPQEFVYQCKGEIFFATSILMLLYPSTSPLCPALCNSHCFPGGNRSALHR